MNTRQKQVTDNIHGTIYLSAIESGFISTPYFYRLHDVYQSSTVYMTFPTNRTKRYEHSLGTMELASSILFSAVSNGEKKAINKLFNKLISHFTDILDHLLNGTGIQEATYFARCEEQVQEILKNVRLTGLKKDYARLMIDRYLKAGIEKGALTDSALDYYQYYPTNTEEGLEPEDILNFFLYRCLLEALRINALFHDVGHPPFSHIIESVLEELYSLSKNEKISKQWDENKLAELQRHLDPYMNNEKDIPSVCKMMLSKSKNNKKEQFHEKIGLSILQSTIREIIPQLIKEETINSSSTKAYRVTKTLYYITIAEFTMAIRMEQDAFFKSIHKIIDGELDADRLDYITRDSLNSGVNWGHIPYKRIINSAKLVLLDSRKDELAIAYPSKTTDSIIDSLLIRYKIFARINSHHSCVKSTVTLQSAVLDIALDYLTNPDDSNCINPDVKTLWEALGFGVGNRSFRIIQWNDSWLITMLHNAMVKINDENYNNHNPILSENLEEILLNRKRFCTLLKRGIDCKNFIDKVFKQAGITEKTLTDLENLENKKYYNSIDVDTSNDELLANANANAEDAIKRIRRLRSVKETGDFEQLDYFMPLDEGDFQTSIEICLNTLKEKEKIADFKTIRNDGRKKTGLPSHETSLDYIYLYDNSGLFTLDENLSLKIQLLSMLRTVPWIYIYFVPKDNCPDVGTLAEEITDFLAQEIGNKLKNRYEELFGKAD